MYFLNNSPIRRGYIRKVGIHLVQNIFHIISVLIVLLAAKRWESNLMKTISKRDSEKIETIQWNC